MDGKIVYNIFSQTDPEIHAQWRKPISKHYSTNGVLPLEPHVGNVLTEFCTSLESRYIKDGEDTACSLDKWLLYCEWSNSQFFFVALTSFSQSHGMSLGR